MLKQTYKKYEILIVDDNGNDSEFRELTEKCMIKYADKKCIRYLKHEKNLGGCAARNTGIKNAKGNYIGFLDDDDEWSEFFLEKILVEFENENIGAVYCKAYIEKRGMIFKENLLKKGNVFNELLNGWCPSSTSLFIVRKECFEKVGKFDENLKSFQDYDMWLRIAQKFYLSYTDEFLVIKYEGCGEQVSFNPYNRLEALEVLEKKWKKILDEKEKKIFDRFLEQHLMQIRRNFIIYNKEKGIKCNYLKLYKDYCQTKTRVSRKFFMMFVCLFGVKVLYFKEFLIGRLKIKC